MAVFDELIDQLEDAAHTAVSGANRDTKEWLKSRAPVDNDEMRQGIRVLKERGRQGDEIDSQIYVVGTQALSRSYSRSDEVPNQLVANATNAETGWANGSLDYWQDRLTARLTAELAKL